MAKILIAEDDSAMRRFLAAALVRAGHEVETRENGLSALEALKQEGKFDLLLADIVMPGMDGIELSQQASRLDEGMKVMFITGFAAVAKAGTAGHGQATVLAKPFHLKDLISRVDELLAA